MLQLFKLAHAHNATNGHKCDKDNETVHATANAATHDKRGHTREQQRRVAAIAKKSNERGGTREVPEHVGRR
jgi:hypothetical protein